MMVHFFNTDPTDVAVTCPRRPIDIAGHAKFYSINFESFRDDVGNLYMAFDMLIFGD
jgi:hypothetical protein